MTGIHMTAKRRLSVGGSFDATAFSASDSQTGSTSASYVELNADGTAALYGSVSTSPSSPKWWTALPPSTWVSYSSTGGGTIIGGLTAGVRYEINTTRLIGINRSTLGTASRTFTLSFYDAASGGTLVGTKTLTTSVDVT